MGAAQTCENEAFRALRECAVCALNEHQVCDSCCAVLKRFDALVFDCDGTLVDSMPMHFESFQEVCREFGLDFSEQRFYELGGVPVDTIFERLGREQGVNIDVQRCVAMKNEVFHRTFIHNVTEIACVTRYARAALQMGIPCGVCSGSERRDVLTELRDTGLLELFADDAIVTREDVKHGKPAPDPYLLAADRLGVSGKQCIAFEDSHGGVSSIMAAHMCPVYVPDLHLYPRRY
ncbi:Fructose-1-phosphate phosphatase YqaB [Porphyridium purpureum]|uniref:Fructose-1-phosphate phosphatase YqaB n=1 Tax=Porphyridium purpureum TaxID=35688 RepID=A0A5J4Z5X3_PORPP|nr:Fructose-1-phosphate phosphatase YqaB [Porphyridium purpureum]|eukprot:POR7049..scf295_1